MSKKVYFACSIRGGGDTSNYRAIVQAVKASHAEGVSEVFVGDAIELGGSPLPDAEIFQRDTKWIREADVVIAEVTNPSLGVGYELAYAEALKKPVLALFDASSHKKLSAMVAGNPAFIFAIYTNGEDVQQAVKDFLK